jgi:DNA-binding NarL/FixJ family response regulator
MRQPVRVVLADDHDAFVEGLGMVLSAEGDLEVVAVAGDGAAALQAVVTHRPDVLVADTHMPGPEIGELVRLVGAAQPATRVLLLAEDAVGVPIGRPDPGPAGTSRAVSGHELAEAIRQVAAGGWVTVAPAALSAAPPTPTPPQPAPDRPRLDRGTPRGHPERGDTTDLLLRSLSERERQILALLGRGYANRRIAETCNLSLNTVRTHVQNVLVKLGVHSKLEAATIAVRYGVAGDDSP